MSDRKTFIRNYLEKHKSVNNMNEKQKPEGRPMNEGLGEDCSTFKLLSIAQGKKCNLLNNITLNRVKRTNLVVWNIILRFVRNQN